MRRGCWWKGCASGRLGRQLDAFSGAGIIECLMQCTIPFAASGVHAAVTSHLGMARPAAPHAPPSTTTCARPPVCSILNDQAAQLSDELEAAQKTINVSLNPNFGSNWPCSWLLRCSLCAPAAACVRSAAGPACTASQILLKVALPGTLSGMQDKTSRISDLYGQIEDLEKQVRLKQLRWCCCHWCRACLLLQPSWQ